MERQRRANGVGRIPEVRRRLNTWIPVVSLLLCAVTVALSLRSYLVAYRLSYDRAEVQKDRIIRRDRSVSLSWGNLSISLARRYYPRGGTRVFDPQSVGRMLNPVWRVEQPFVPWHWSNWNLSAVGSADGVELLGLRAGTESWSIGLNDEYTGWRLVVPCWCVATLFAVPPAWWVVRRVRSRRLIRSGRCPACFYDLTGNVSGVCPECGARLLVRDRERGGGGGCAPCPP